MCMSIVFHGKRKEKALDKIKNRVYFWKSVLDYGHYQSPLYYNCKGGIIPKTGGEVKYSRHGSYFFTTREAAQNYMYGRRVVRVKINPKDIVRIGSFGDHCFRNLKESQICIQTRKATWPEYRRQRDKTC